MNLAEVVQATWPPARSFALGPFTLREGAGGGKRVSSASVHGPFSPDDLTAAEAEMRRLGQNPLFVIYPDEGDFGLDAALDLRGYRIIDPVVGYRADCRKITAQSIDISVTYPQWPPLAITLELWASAGIGAARVQVMARAQGPKTAILVRRGDHPAGVCFVALAGITAMIHALDVLEPFRRQGLAQKLIARAADWALGLGAVNLSLVVTHANAPARALYARMGMEEIGAYHYREAPSPAAPH